MQFLSLSSTDPALNLAIEECLLQWLPADHPGLFLLWQNAPGVIVKDDPANNVYPMAIDAENTDEVFVGRIRKDDTVDSGVNLWVVADNIRKGAATNAVQIAEKVLQMGLIK